MCVGVYEECSIVVYALTLTDDDKPSLKFAPNEQYKLPKVHDLPVGAALLSRQQARFCVTSGDNKDINMKLFNLQSQESEHRFKTGHSKHTYLVQGKEFDLFSVVGNSNEVRIYQIAPGHKNSHQLDKLTTIVSHQQPVTDVSISETYVCTISHKEGIIALHKLDFQL